MHFKGVFFGILNYKTKNAVKYCNLISKNNIYIFSSTYPGASNEKYASLDYTDHSMKIRDIKDRRIRKKDYGIFIKHISINKRILKLLVCKEIEARQMGFLYLEQEIDKHERKNKKINTV